MVVQPRAGGFRCVRQHDHAIASGELARAWRGLGGDERLDFPTVLAIGMHDIGWRGPDARVDWDPSRGAPFDFVTTPFAERVRIYREGIEAMEALHPWAGLLGARHFLGFIEGQDAAFDAEMRARVVRLRTALARSREEEERAYALLKLLDALSLVLCLTLPGGDADAVPRWLRMGATLDGQAMDFTWDDATTLRVTPSPFVGDVPLRLPYRDLSADGAVVGDGVLRLRVV